MAKVTWFTIASNDEHPININKLNEKTDQHSWIRHDDERENTPHTHYVGHLPKNRRTEVSNIAKWAGVPDNMVEIVRSSVGILTYLTHENEPDKVRYSSDKIQGNIDIVSYVAQENAKIQKANSLSAILTAIDNDEIVEYNLTECIGMESYVKFSRQIERAFKYKNDKGNTEDRDMEVWYIYGNAGSGKTTIAKEIAKQLQYRCYISAGGKNPFDDYKGEPCVILDDARPSDWKFSDFLKLTDNNTSSMVGCRYYNKHFYRCKLLIVTNCEPLNTWYKGLQEFNGEALEQLTRRFSRIVQIVRTDKKHGIIKAHDHTEGVDIFFDLPTIAQKRSKIDWSSVGAKIMPKGQQMSIQTNFEELSPDDELPL